MQISSDYSVKFDHVTKQYHTGTRQFRYFREMAQESLLSLVGKDHRHMRGRINALNDVNISIKKGERVALMGKNGSGKSTFLKVVAKVTKPTSGSVLINGSVGALIEVTVGFRPELTGRSNVYFNAAIQGLSSKQIKERYDDIIAFSELGSLNDANWLETPVKWYSSGMYVRLGFSIAAYLNPDILIVDEVLAVGDTDYQQKCLKRMSEIADGGRTVIFVSHALESSRKLCQRGIVLDKGHVVMDSDINAAINFYERLKAK